MHVDAKLVERNTRSLTITVEESGNHAMWKAPVPVEAMECRAWSKLLWSLSLKPGARSTATYAWS